jgi:hypothetical protein
LCCWRSVNAGLSRLTEAEVEGVDDRRNRRSVDVCQRDSAHVFQPWREGDGRVEKHIGAASYGKAKDAAADCRQCD